MSNTVTLKDVLPADQCDLVNERVQNLTKGDLERIMSKSGDDHHDLNPEEIKSLTRLAAVRLKKGQSLFGFDAMNVDLTSDEGPNRNW